MYFVYILKSKKNESFYVGYSKDVKKRLEEHNKGKVKATRPRIPFEVIYTELFTSATEARKREYFIKNQKSRKYILQLIDNALVAQLDRAPRWIGEAVTWNIKHYFYVESN